VKVCVMQLANTMNPRSLESRMPRKCASPVREGAVGKGPLRLVSCREADNLLRNLAGRLLHRKESPCGRL
jgi:hypothetical protein